MRSTSKPSPSRRKRFRVRGIPWRVVGLTYLVSVVAITAISPPPAAVGLLGQPREARDVVFLGDLSWLDGNGQRRLNQSIFNAVIEQIKEAKSAILVDMFLFNDWQGPKPETHRALAAELTAALIAKKQQSEDISIIVISDPVNTVYGGIPSKHFTELEQSGIDVVETHLPHLQDSNPMYSGIWRWLIRPFGNSAAKTLPNPLGEGDVSLRSYLALLNFKANHRKLLVTDTPNGELRATVMSANPHDGSSAHRNVGLQFGGDAVVDLLQAERALLELNEADLALSNWPAAFSESQIDGPMVQIARDNSDFHELHPGTTFSPTLRIVNESAIEAAVVEVLKHAKVRQKVDLVMFYLSDRHVINALLDAHARDVELRVLLDVNKDAFGRSKNGVPNQPVAKELSGAGIDVRWCVTLGEQCHAKMLLSQGEVRDALLLGSGNYTRRNLDNFNLESNVLYAAPQGSDVVRDAAHYFDVQWSNAESREYSAHYSIFAKDQWWLWPQYRFMEFTGIGTF